jgi:hypothetical protein
MNKILVFFAYFGCNDEADDNVVKRFILIDKQLQYVSLLEKTKPFHKKYLVATIPSKLDCLVKLIAAKYGYTIANTSLSRKNTFEYPAFSLMSKLSAVSDENDIIYYFHSKGSGNPTDFSFEIFKMHVNALIRMNVDEVFSNEHILRAGLFPAQQGWLWHNFFAIRSSVLNKRIVRSKDRYHYESAIGVMSDIHCFKSVHSLIPELYPDTSFEIKEFYIPDELVDEKTKVLMVPQ